jgi:hypothetical protein
MQCIIGPQELGTTSTFSSLFAKQQLDPFADSLIH